MWLLVKNSIYLRVMSVLWEQAHIIHLSMLRGLPSHIPYSRQLSREKTFRNFAVLWHLRKFSPRKLYFHQFVKVFFPWKFPAMRYDSSCYRVLMIPMCVYMIRHSISRQLVVMVWRIGTDGTVEPLSQGHLTGSQLYIIYSPAEIRTPH